MTQNRRIGFWEFAWTSSVTQQLEHLQTEMHLYPACTWQRCQSEYCYCRRSRREWPPSQAHHSPSGRWSRQTRSHRCWEREDADSKSFIYTDSPDFFSICFHWCETKSCWLFTPRDRQRFNIWVIIPHNTREQYFLEILEYINKIKKIIPIPLISTSLS